MFRSQNFLAQEQHLHKKVSPGSEEYLNALRSLMLRQLSQFPEALVVDIMDYAVTNNEENSEAVRVIAEMIDLFWMQYDDRADPLGGTDWEFLRDTIDAYALDLDMNLVQYVMERVVDHHAL
ncbi:MAG: hypothetical protein ACLFSV_03795 [Alkalispirochaeta sp.]